MSALNGPERLPADGGQPRKLVLLLHGLGADGNDLISLAEPWGRLVPHTHFAAPDAPATRMPSKVHIMARPVLDGKMGSEILAKELLLMVIRPPEIISSADGAAEQVAREE